MKKFLLLTAAALTASTAMAELTDVTPKAYNFESDLEIPFFNPYEFDATIAAWNPPYYFITQHPEYYKDGFVMVIGPEIKNGKYDTFIKGTKVIDMGGEIGKVLCLGGFESNAQAALKQRGIDIELPRYDSTPGYLIPFWHADPNVNDGMANGVENACRVRIVLNIFHNTPSSTDSRFQPYLQTGSNGTLGDNESLDRFVYPTDFCYNWGEAESDNHQIDWSTATADDLALYSTQEGDIEDFAELGQGESGYVWNPNRWMVYEYDTPFMDGDGEESEVPVKIKMELPGLNNCTIFIKSIQFLMKDENEDLIPEKTRRKTWKYMNAGTTSIADIMNDVNTFGVNVNGNDVIIEENASIYAVTGACVATVTSGQKVTLPTGFYVAVAGRKSVKFSVK